ncbi:MAG TPA: tRNA pseudouridine(38-40) synthase TruA [Bacillota bacterium]|nr:tRNA pseudouridine(38-40) synthase TruA [Bacillota bacterium]
MHNYKLTISYDGEHFRGWQRLGNGENTIQGKIENALSVLLGYPIEIVGASRTDAGVHALAQTANFKAMEDLSADEIRHFLNHYLPKAISITAVEEVSERFHSRYNAKAKTYLYKIWNETYSNPFMRFYSMQVEKKLDLNKMKKSCQYFLGEHDFTAYSNAKSNNKDKIRTIYSLELEKKDGFLQIRICGDGFLYNMVRKIVGTLIEIGLGEKEAEEIPLILLSTERILTGIMAEAEGLYLEKIAYEND